jgi:hypothetical protein
MMRPAPFRGNQLAGNKPGVLQPNQPMPDRRGRDPLLATNVLNRPSADFMEALKKLPVTRLNRKPHRTLSEY